MELGIAGAPQRVFESGPVVVATGAITKVEAEVVRRTQPQLDISTREDMIADGFGMALGGMLGTLVGRAPPQGMGALIGLVLAVQWSRNKRR